MLAKRTNRKTAKARRPRATQPWYKKKYNALQMAQKAAAGVWHLKGIINSELKIHQYLSGQNDLDYSGRMDNLTQIAQGETEEKRIGNSLFVRYLNVKGVVKTADSNAPATVRLMIIQDNSVDPSSTTVSDVLAQSTVGTVYAPLSSLNRDSGIGRFKVLASKLITVNNLAQQSAAYNFNIEMRHHIKFDGTLSSDLKKGSLYFLQISDLTGTGVPINQFMARVKYYDN